VLEDEAAGDLFKIAGRSVTGSTVEVRDARGNAVRAGLLATGRPAGAVPDPISNGESISLSGPQVA